MLTCYHLVARLMTVTDLLVPTRLIQAVRNKLLRACAHQLVNNLLRANDIRLVGTRNKRVCWSRQPCYKMITTCSRLVNNWEQAVRTHLPNKLETSRNLFILRNIHHGDKTNSLRLRCFTRLRKILQFPVWL